MKLFRNKEKNRGAEVQIRSAEKHPFSVMEDYVPLRNGELKLYRAIREAVPVVDAAIIKMLRLAGGVKAVCADKKAESELNRFFETVNVGRGQRGINAFIDSYLDSLITCGRAVGEIVLSGRRDIAAVLCGNVEDIEIKEGATPMDFDICTADDKGKIRPLKYQDLILFTPFNPESTNPYGVSMLRAMPFLSDILLKIYNSLGVNWERAGNVRFAVIYKPKEDSLDRAYARERSEQIAKEWSAAMQETKNGSVRDFVAVGDVEIKVIGADNQVLDSEVPVRQILEQLIARTGIPPFMLGLNWSSTERMSSQQADLLTSEITAIRRTLSPVVERIGEMWLRLHGYSCACRAEWDEINLQDETQEAQAALHRAQAEYYRAGAAVKRAEVKEKENR